MAIQLQDYLNRVGAEIGQIVAGPAPSDRYFNSLVQAVLPLLPTYWTIAQGAALPPWNFSKVELVALLTRLQGLQSLLGPLMAKMNSRLDSFLSVQVREIYENVVAAIASTLKEIEVVRVRIAAGRTPVLAAILQQSPVDFGVPKPPVGVGQPQRVESLPWQPDPNAPWLAGVPVCWPWVDGYGWAGGWMNWWGP